jgi:hypothetical protein
MPCPPPVTITTFSFNPSIILDSSFDLPLCYSRISSHTISVISIGKGTESSGATAPVCVGMARVNISSTVDRLMSANRLSMSACRL